MAFRASGFSSNFLIGIENSVKSIIKMTKSSRLNFELFYFTFDLKAPFRVKADAWKAISFFSGVFK